MLRIQRCTPRAAFSILELLIAMMILTMLLGVIGMTVMRGGGAFKQGVAASVVEGQARRAVDRIADEFSGARVASLAPVPAAPFGASTLDFDESAGYAAGLVIPGTTSRIALQSHPSDPDDGIDNNGNGLVDEGQIVLRRDVGLATETSVVLVPWVREFSQGETENGVDDNGNGLIDERGLSFEIVGQTLNIRVTLERLDPDQQPIVRTVETSVRLRN